MSKNRDNMTPERWAEIKATPNNIIRLHWASSKGGSYVKDLHKHVEKHIRNTRKGAQPTYQDTTQEEA